MITMAMDKTISLAKVNSIYDVYLNILNNTNYSKYALYDIDKDDVPELILGEQYNGQFYVYGYKNEKVVDYGELYTQYGIYKYDENGIIICTGGTGLSIYLLIYEDNGYLLEREVPYLECNAVYPEDIPKFYFNGEMITEQQYENYEQEFLPIDFHAIDDLSFLNTLVNTQMHKEVSNYSEKTIEQVKKYTSHFDWTEINNCLQNGEYEKAKELIEQSDDGYHERWDYKGLVTNDMYIAYQFKEYMTGDFFSKGWWANVTTWFSGLFYNDELREYLSLQSPGKNKYKDMLKQFIADTQNELVCLKYSEDLISALGSVDEFAEYFRVDTYDKVYEMLAGADNKEEIDKAVKQFVDYNWDYFEKEGKRYLFKNDLSESFTFLGAGVEYIDTTVSAIMDIQYICANKKVLDYYIDLLDNIQNVKDENQEYIAPKDLREAAQELKKELEGDIFDVIETSINEYGVTTVTTGAELVGLIKKGFLSSILLGVEISSLIGDKAFDMSSLVNGVSYVQGYAYLGEIYSIILENDKTEFLNNQSEKNAKRFESDYKYLWLIRLKGEEAYLDMTDFSGTWANDNRKILQEWINYSEKKNFCDDNIKMIEDFKFRENGEIMLERERIN